MSRALNGTLAFLCIVVVITLIAMYMEVVSLTATELTFNNYTYIDYNNYTTNQYDYSKNYTTYSSTVKIPLRHFRACEGKTESYKATGQSMQPLLAEDQEFRVMQLDWNKITPHDVISVDVNSTYIVTHAICYRSDTYIKTCGYANTKMDNWTVYPAMVVGVLCQ